MTRKTAHSHTYTHKRAHIYMYYMWIIIKWFQLNLKKCVWLLFAMHNSQRRLLRIQCACSRSKPLSHSIRVKSPNIIIIIDIGSSSSSIVEPNTWAQKHYPIENRRLFSCLCSSFICLHLKHTHTHADRFVNNDFSIPSFIPIVRTFLMWC